MFLQRIFPEWSITKGDDGDWRVSGHVRLSVSSLDGALDVLAVAEPEAEERVRRFFLRGEVTMTTALVEFDGGTEITMVQEGMPDAVSPSDNELGMRMALDNLAKLVEG